MKQIYIKTLTNTHDGTLRKAYSKISHSFYMPKELQLINFSLWNVRYAFRFEYPLHPRITVR